MLQFILGFGVGLIISISVSLVIWNQSNSISDVPVKKPLKKIKKHSEMKMVLIVPKNLNANKHEVITKGIYATIGAFKESLIINPNLVKHWQRWGQPKITLKVNDEAELLSIKEVADNENLVNFMVKNVNSSKNDVQILAIGPDCSDDINKVTGHLKLY